MTEKSKLYNKIDEILWNDWDPIGINNCAPRDEYQGYVPEIVKLVESGASLDEIAKHLHNIETNIIGVKGSIVVCDLVANKIIKI